MVVSQFIKIRNAPSRPFIAKATMPLAVDADPATVGNSINGFQQYRRIARMRTWDIYEWMVECPAGVGRVDLADTFEPQLVFKSGRLGEATIAGGRGGVGLRRPIENLLQQQAPALLDPAAVRLEFDGPDGISTVNISGPSGRTLRPGPLCVTTENHKWTPAVSGGPQRPYGALHYWWTVTKHDPIVRLQINLHTGIPAREVLLRSIKLILPPELNWVKEITDPACLRTTEVSWLLQPYPNPNEYYLFPRMAQRVWRLLFWARTNLSGTPHVLARQDSGWGVASWNNGGFGACDMKVPDTLLDHVPNDSSGRDLRGQVEAEALADDTNLGGLVNEMDFVDGSPSHQGFPPYTVLWPAVGQGYGGPTGSDGKYKPYHGIKPLAANCRQGLIKLKVEQLRHHSRDWTVIYEQDGRIVVPEEHLNANGEKTWSAAIAGSQFFQSQTNPWHPYARPWKDFGPGLGFSAPAFHVQRLPGQRIELQTFDGIQRWDNWDGQHRMLLWAADMALAWLEADPCSIKYLVGEAERTRMVQWAGAGLTTFSVPGSQGLGVVWGREIAWSMYAIACALPFVQADSQETDDDGNPLTPSTRRSRWVDGELKVFVQGTEKAMMPSGVAWHAATDSSSKGFTDPPFGDGGMVGNYFLVQLFEVGYGLNALHACYGVKGDHWRSLLGPQQVNVRNLGIQFARCIETVAKMGTQTVASAAIVAGQAGLQYVVGDIVTVADDRARGGSAHSALAAPVLPRLRVDTVDGAGAVTALSVFDAGRVFQQPTQHVWDGIAGALTMCVVSGGSVAAGGTGYQNLNNQVVSVSGGVPLNVNETAQFRLTVVGGIITGVLLVRTGRYLEPPPSPSIVPGGDGNATLNLTRSCVGKNLRVTLTYAAIIFAAPGTSTEAKVWKHFPIGPYPGSTRYTTNADFVPLDICARSAHDNPFTNGVSGIGQQDQSYASLQNCIGLWGFASLEIGDPGGHAFAVAKRVTTQTTAAGMFTFWKNEGIGRAAAGELIENWWPALAYFSQVETP